MNRCCGLRVRVKGLRLCGGRVPLQIAASRSGLALVWRPFLRRFKRMSPDALRGSAYCECLSPLNASYRDRMPNRLWTNWARRCRHRMRTKTRLRLWRKPQAFGCAGRLNFSTVVRCTVVGSRACSRVAEDRALAWAKLARARGGGGFRGALGIDAAAHRGALSVWVRPARWLGNRHRCIIPSNTRPCFWTDRGKRAAVVDVCAGAAAAPLSHSQRADGGDRRCRGGCRGARAIGIAYHGASCGAAPRTTLCALTGSEGMQARWNPVPSVRTASMVVDLSRVWRCCTPNCGGCCCAIRCRQKAGPSRRL